MLNLYDILGVSPSAAPEEIRRAYKRRAAEVHPDINPSPDAAALFRIVREAAEILTDPARREAYDRSRRADGAEPPKVPQPVAAPPRPPEPPRVTLEDQFDREMKSFIWIAAAAVVAVIAIGLAVR